MAAEVPEEEAQAVPRTPVVVVPRAQARERPLALPQALPGPRAHPMRVLQALVAKA